MRPNLPPPPNGAVITLPFALLLPNLERMGEEVKSREVNSPELSDGYWW